MPSPLTGEHRAIGLDALPGRSPEGRVVNGSPGRRRRRIVARSLPPWSPSRSRPGASISTDDTRGGWRSAPPPPPPGLADQRAAPAPSSGTCSTARWCRCRHRRPTTCSPRSWDRCSTLPTPSRWAGTWTTSVPVDTKVEHLDLADGDPDRRPVRRVRQPGRAQPPAGDRADRPDRDGVPRSVERVRVPRRRHGGSGADAHPRRRSHGVSECDYASLLADPGSGWPRPASRSNAIQRTQARRGPRTALRQHRLSATLHRNRRRSGPPSAQLAKNGGDLFVEVQVDRFGPPVASASGT